jgi:hypothetical protein
MIRLHRGFVFLPGDKRLYFCIMIERDDEACAVMIPSKVAPPKMIPSRNKVIIETFEQ